MGRVREHVKYPPCLLTRTGLPLGAAPVGGRFDSGKVLTMCVFLFIVLCLSILFTTMSWFNMTPSQAAAALADRFQAAQEPVMTRHSVGGRLEQEGERRYRYRIIYAHCADGQELFRTYGASKQWAPASPCRWGGCGHAVRAMLSMLRRMLRKSMCCACCACRPPPRAPSSDESQ